MQQASGPGCGSVSKDVRAAQLGADKHVKRCTLSGEVVTETWSRMHSSAPVQMIEGLCLLQLSMFIGGVGRKGEAELPADEARRCSPYARRMGWIDIRCCH